MAAIKKHGHPLYSTWSTMLDRCINPRNTAFARYGARGIRVCDRWRGPDGFANFVEDMGERPPHLTLDRINNDGNYEPGNCRWAGRSLQLLNRSPRPGPDPSRLSTQGRAALVVYLQTSKQTALATALHVSQVQVCRWGSGRDRPAHHLRVGLERIAGIAASDWMTDTEFASAYGAPRQALRSSA